MAASPLEPNPIATYLLSLAEHKATGFVDIGGRRVLLDEGQVTNVSPAPGDESLGEFLLHSGRINVDHLNKAYYDSEKNRTSLDLSLIARGSINEFELTEAYRSLWLDRIFRGLRAMWYAKSDLPTLDFATVTATTERRVSLLILVLDALSRWAAEEDAAIVGAHLNSHLVWLETPYTEPAKTWSAFSLLPAWTIMSISM